MKLKGVEFIREPSKEKYPVKLEEYDAPLNKYPVFLFPERSLTKVPTPA